MGNRLYFRDNLGVQRHVEAKPAPDAISEQFRRGILWGTVLSAALWVALALTLVLVLA